MRDRILHLADLHLGDGHTYLRHRATTRRVEADSVLDRVADRVLDTSSRIGGVLLAGDVFDHYDPDPSLVERVLRTLHRLDEAGIRLLTVPGNHDEYSYPSCVYRQRTDDWPGTLVTRARPGKVDTWRLDGGIEIDLYGMAFVAGQSQPPYDTFSVEPSARKKIAVLHGTLDLEATDRSIPLRSAELAKLGLDYVALGHLHTSMERRISHGWIAYPGRIEGGGFNDPGGSDLLEIGFRGDAVSWNRVPFPHRSIEEQVWNLSALESESELVARLDREAARDPERILRVRFDGLAGFPLDVQSLQEEWTSRFFFLELVAPMHSIDLDRLDLLASEPTIRGRFAKVAQADLARANTEEERQRCLAALRFGLAAFAAERAVSSGPGRTGAASSGVPSGSRASAERTGAGS